MIKTAWVPDLMRVVLGLLFVAHSISKFQMGLGNVAAWFGSYGTPGFLAYIAGWLELFGGILLIVGLFTRYVSALFTVLLIGAILYIKLPIGLISYEMPGYELELAYLMLTIYFIFIGPGPLSIDKLFLGKRKPAGLSA